MLVLARRVGEEIMIGGNVAIRVIAVKGGGARLGINAPDGVRIDRKEIHDLRAEFAEPELLHVAG